MIRFILPRLILGLLAVSLGGLLFCRLIDFLFFHNGPHLDQTAVGLWILRFLEIIFAGTVLILIPLEIVLSRSEVKEVRKFWAEGKIDPKELPSFQKHLFYSNYADVPKWVYLPFVILAGLLAAVFALGLIVSIVLALVWAMIHLVLFFWHLFGH